MSTHTSARVARLSKRADPNAYGGQPGVNGSTVGSSSRRDEDEFLQYITCHLW